jgi:type IV pilus assembly protein PilO
MKLSDFSNLDTSNVGSWPAGVKYTFAALLVALICVAGWYFKISDQQAELERVAYEEQGLRDDFRKKQGRVVNLEAYREQLAAMKVMFQELVQQLPNATEMPKLIENISQSALQAGIDTQLFSPGAETKRDFYAEKPISVRMIGDYHQFGDFVSHIAALSRVVILELTSLSPQPVNQQDANRGVRRGATAGSGTAAPLRLEGTIRTFRYLDEAEQSQANDMPAGMP